MKKADRVVVGLEIEDEIYQVALNKSKQQPREWFDKYRDLLIEANEQYTLEQIHEMINKELGLATLKRVKANAFGCIGEPTARVNFYRLRKAMNQNEG